MITIIVISNFEHPPLNISGKKNFSKPSPTPCQTQATPM